MKNHGKPRGQERFIFCQTFCSFIISNCFCLVFQFFFFLSFLFRHLVVLVGGTIDDSIFDVPSLWFVPRLHLSRSEQQIDQIGQCEKTAGYQEDHSPLSNGAIGCQHSDDVWLQKEINYFNVFHQL